MRRGVRGAARVVEAMGAERIFSSHAKWVAYEPGRRGDLDGFCPTPTPAAGAPGRPRRSPSTSWAAPASGARRAISVCDPGGEVWSMPGLYVMDASAFPTASGVNPMVTIEALAHMNARALAARLDCRTCPAPSSSARGPTGSPPPSRSRGPAAVAVLEGRATIGGGFRTAELTLPGFVHDVCSAVHPIGLVSPFLRALPLASTASTGPPAGPAGAPARRRPAVMLRRSLARPQRDSARTPRAYGALVAPFLRDHPTRSSPTSWRRRDLPAPPDPLARFGAPGCAQRTALARSASRRAGARAARRLRRALDPAARAPLTAAFGLIFAAHGARRGWPVARGGSQRIADALASPPARARRRDRDRRRSRSLADLPAAPVLSTSPRGSCASRALLPAGTGGASGAYRYGPGVFKLDWALDGPIPWRSRRLPRAVDRPPRRNARRDRGLRGAVARRAPERPFVLLVQPSLFDPSRAPAGQAHRLGLLPRAARLDPRHDAPRSRRRSSASRPASATASSRATR